MSSVPNRGRLAIASDWASSGWGAPSCQLALPSFRRTSCASSSVGLQAVHPQALALPPAPHVAPGPGQLDALRIEQVRHLEAFVGSDLQAAHRQARAPEQVQLHVALQHHRHAGPAGHGALHGLAQHGPTRHFTHHHTEHQQPGQAAHHPGRAAPALGRGGRGRGVCAGVHRHGLLLKWVMLSIVEGWPRGVCVATNRPCAMAPASLWR